MAIPQKRDSNDLKTTTLLILNWKIDWHCGPWWVGALFESKKHHHLLLLAQVDVSYLVGAGDVEEFGEQLTSQVDVQKLGMVLGHPF